MQKLKCYFLISLLSFSTALFADKECVTFTVTNNLAYAIFIQRDNTQKASICKVPYVIQPGESSQFSIHKNMEPVYLSFRTNYRKLRYDLFASFLVDENNQRIIREEDLSSVAAYSWNDDNSAIYLCLATHYEQMGSCR